MNTSVTVEDYSFLYIYKEMSAVGISGIKKSISA